MRRLWFVIFAATAVFYFCGLGVEFLGRDEPRYAQVAREMWSRGDWVTPTLGGHTWFEKPALLYWMMIASFSVFGPTEAAARIGPALCGILTVALIAWLATRVAHAAQRESASDVIASSDVIARDVIAKASAGQWLALCCAGAMASCGGLIAFARGATFDIAITATIAASLSCFLVADLEDNPRRARLLLTGFYAGMGAALLAKGLIGIVIPVGVALFYLVLRRGPRGVAGLPWIGLGWGPLVALLVASTWYGPVIARHGMVFIDEFIWRQHFARFTSNKYQHSQPVWFYVPVLALFGLPWTAFLIAALVRVRQWNWRARAEDANAAPVGQARDEAANLQAHDAPATVESRSSLRVSTPEAQRAADSAQSDWGRLESSEALHRMRVFALAWMLVPLAFFSISGSKLPGYLMPALPGAALLAGERLAAYGRGQERLAWMRASGVLFVLLGVVALLYGRRSGMIAPATALLVGVPAALGGIFAVCWPQKRVACQGVLAATFFATIALCVLGVLPDVARRGAIGDLMQEAAARGYAGAPVFQLRVRNRTPERSSHWYAGRQMQLDGKGDPLELDDAAQVARAAQNGPVLIIAPKDKADVLRSPLLRLENLGSNAKTTLLAAHATANASSANAVVRK